MENSINPKPCGNRFTESTVSKFYYYVINEYPLDNGEAWLARLYGYKTLIRV
jgi:hypothetical protein